MIEFIKYAILWAFLTFIVFVLIVYSPRIFFDKDTNSYFLEFDKNEKETKKILLWKK